MQVIIAKISDFHFIVYLFEYLPSTMAIKLHIVFLEKFKEKSDV